MKENIDAEIQIYRLSTYFTCLLTNIFTRFILYNNNMLGKFILQQRKKLGLTQDFLASRLGVSRPTYVQIEQGERELTISEAKKLADIFGFDFDHFLRGEDRSIVVEIEKEKKQAKEKIPEIRISVPQKNLKKFKEVFLYVLSEIGSKPNVGESVINKIFYFIDFDYYEKYEEQLIGATYIKNHSGPTPCELKKIVEEMKTKNEVKEVKSKHFEFQQKKYFPLRRPDLSLLTAREVEHIDDVLNRLSDKNAREICDYSHEDVPYRVHKEGEKIDYESVFYRDEKYSVRSYDDEI